MLVYKRKPNGFSLAELMVSVTILICMMFVINAVLERSISTVQQAEISATLGELKSRMDTLVKNPLAWSATYQSTSSNPTMACLLSKVAPGCQARLGAPVAFTLLDASGAAAFRPIVTGGTNQPGFTYKGAPCNTFNDNATGSSTCVIGYRMTWEPSACPPGCVDPPVKLNMNLVFRPKNGVFPMPININKYSMMNFVRGTTALTKYFTVTHEVTGNTGGGSCTTSTNRRLTIPSGGDVFSIISISPTDTVRVAEAGTYNCTLKAAAFGIGEFQSKIVANGAVVAKGSASSDINLQATATTEVVMELSAGSTIRLVTDCPNSTGSSGTYALGKPSQDSGGSYAGRHVYATLVCYVEN